MAVRKRVKKMLSPRGEGKKASDPDPTIVICVTGGAGFLGRHIVERCLKDFKNARIKVLDIRIPPKSEQIRGVEYRTCDLRDASSVSAAICGATVVIHTATAAPTGANAYNKQLMTSVNVDGTRHVKDACIEHGVKALVYTSSASVVFEGKDLYLVDESTPYASKPMDFYTETKILGEQIAIQPESSTPVLPACALRPSGIFGEYDTLTVPTIVQKARAGKMRFQIGNGKNEMDWTYAGNIAAAHTLAVKSLLRDGTGATCAGKAYFITNDDPRPFWGMMGDICEGLGYGRPSKRLPLLPLMIIAHIVQLLVVPLLALFGKKFEMDFTPFRLAVSTTNRTFSCERAKRDFGYDPEVRVEEALERTFKYFGDLRNK